MANIKHLSTLIRSLSKSEKRYFKWSYPWQAGEKIYGDLYDLIESGNHSGTTIKDNLSRIYPNVVLEPACKHLYKMLMRSLRNYESDKGVDNKLVNLLCDVKILFNKGMFELCFSELKKAKKLALRYEKFGFYVLFARQELQYLTYLEFPDTDENDLVNKQEKIQEVLNHELFISRHSSLYELLTYRYLQRGNVRNEKEVARLNDLLLEEFQVNASKKYNSFESDMLHLHFQSTYFLMAGSPDQSLQLFKELNILFQRNNSLWMDSPVYYIYLLHGVLTSLQLIERHSDMPYFLKELQQVPSHSESLQTFKEHLVYFHRIEFLNAQGDIEETLALAKEYEELFLTKRTVVAPNASAAMYFRLAVIYFSAGNFSKSLQLVNAVLNTPSTFISSQLYVLDRLLHLLIHLELQNDDYLHYEIKSVERKLKNVKKLFEIEKITLQFLKKWLSTSNRTKVLEEYATALAELQTNDYESHLLRQFPFLKWATDRLQKQVKSKDITYTTIG